MANKYFKNFIICGEVDFHCLLCKESFQALAEVEKHTRWETHRKAVKSQTRSPKFKKDAVFKIGEQFYCEICNWVAPDMEKIIAHVREEKHLTNKGKPKSEEEIATSKCKRDSGYVIISNIILDMGDWHGIVGRECVICGVEILSSMQHINTAEHVLKLIEAGVVIEDKDKCYRKISKDRFYCFTCKKVIPSSDYETHWSDKEHCEEKTCIYRVTVNTREQKILELKRKLLMSQSKHFFINLDREEAVCKKCRKLYKTDKTEFKLMVSHVDEHPKDEVVPEPANPQVNVESPSSEEDPDDVVYTEVADHGKRRSELSKYGKDNFIKLNPGGARGYCKLCHTYLSGHLKCFKQHVRGSRHRGFLELMGLKMPRNHTLPDIKYMPVTDFLEILFYAQHVNVLWVNKKFCVDIHTFLMVSNVDKNPHNKVTKCFVCDDYYPQGQDLKHYETELHKKKFLGAKVLVVKEEFIREIRPDIYHCGFCNKVYPFWELMNQHLQSSKHKYNKNQKDLVLRCAEDWISDHVVTTTSKHPDIMYIQFINLGVFTSWP